MTPIRAAVIWLLVAICVITYALVLVELIVLVRRVLRLKSRAAGLARPFAGLAPKAQADRARLTAATAQLQELLVRAAIAVARIRATVKLLRSLVPRS